MGRLSELHRYLQIPPQKLEDFKKEMTYLTITEDLKKLRKELKKYKE